MIGIDGSLQKVIDLCKVKPELMFIFYKILSYNRKVFLRIKYLPTMRKSIFYSMVDHVRFMSIFESIEAIVSAYI